MVLIDNVDWELEEELPETEPQHDGQAAGCAFPPCPTCGGPGIKVSRKHRGYKRRLPFGSVGR